MIPKILIVIEGGVAEVIAATLPIEVHFVDRDFDGPPNHTKQIYEKDLESEAEFVAKLEEFKKLES